VSKIHILLEMDVECYRDDLKLVADTNELLRLAASVDDTAGVLVVPALSGFRSPHWRTDASGAIIGLSAFAKREHICRAALLAVVFQVREVMAAFDLNSSPPILHMLQSRSSTLCG